MDECTLAYDLLHELTETGDLPDCVGGLQSDEAHLWSIHTEACRFRIAGLESLLSRDEQRRSQQFRLGRDRDLFVAGRVVTRILLASYAGVEPKRVSIQPGEYGKPFTNTGIRFNISHSNNQLLLGFSSGPIGVDIEHVDSKIDVGRLAQRHFTELEVRHLLKQDLHQRSNAFFQIWTRKESVVKGIGKGLGISFRDFAVTGRDQKVQWTRPGGQQYGNWYVHELDAPPGYAAAVATRQEKIRLRHFILEG